MLEQLIQLVIIILIILAICCGCGSGFYFYKYFHTDKANKKYFTKGSLCIAAIIAICLLIVSLNDPKQQFYDFLDNLF